jgi:hypothetical protein
VWKNPRAVGKSKKYLAIEEKIFDAILVQTLKKKKKLGPKLATYPISNLFGTSRTWPNFLALKHLFSLCYTNIDKYSLSLLSITTERKKENWKYKRREVFS